MATRTHFKTRFRDERLDLPSEKPAAGGSVTKVTLTSDAGFAAGKVNLSGRNGVLK